MNLNRKTIRGLLAAFFLVLWPMACLKPTKPPSGLVEHQSYSIRFWGYRSTVLVKAGPEEIDRYNLDPSNLIQSGGSLGLQIVSGDKFAQPGDRVEYSAEAAGLPIRVAVVLAAYEPGSRLSFVVLLNDSLMAFVRYSTQRLGANSKLTIELEVEETNPLLDQILEQARLNETIMKLEDEAMARMQMNFDPELKMENLDLSGLRGERFEKLYPAHQATVNIAAPVEKVAAYLAGPDFTALMKEKYSLDFGRAFQDQRVGTYQIKVNFLGNQTEPLVFILSYLPGKHVFAYWTAKLNSRIQFFMRPAPGGTEFTMAFLTESPSALTMELASILMNNAQIPNFVESALLDIKAAVEGSV